MSLRPACAFRLLAASLLATGAATALAQDVASASARVTAPAAASPAERPVNEESRLRALVPGVAGVQASPVTSASSARRWVTSAEWSGRSYRWSAQRGGVDLGISFDASEAPLSPLDLHRDASALLVPTLPTISLGMRQAGRVSAATLLERALGASEPGGSISRVGIEWKPAQPQVEFLRGGLGVRLDGNDRMTVRLRKGMFAIYMHRKF